MTDQPCSQIPIPEAVEFLLADHPEPHTWQEYLKMYYRKPTQAEQRAHYNEPEGMIMVTAMMVEREDALEPENKPFQRFCVIPDRWREMARDMMIENEFTSLGFVKAFTEG